MKKVLTIAGSDSCGGAGIQADIKAMSAQGVYAMSVITAITAQNTCGVSDIEELSPKIIESQIDAIFTDIAVDAVKIGMLSSSKIIEAVKKGLKKYKVKNIVIDPVMVSKSGSHLLKKEAIESLKTFLPMATLLTPNIPEAEVLSEMKIESIEDMIEAGRKIQQFGVENVLVKGGHLEGECIDILLLKDNRVLKFNGKRLKTKNTHGTGCTLSSSIATHLAKGSSLEKSVELAKEYITEAISNSFSIGHGVGPTGHFISLYKKANMEY